MENVSGSMNLSAILFDIFRYVVYILILLGWVFAASLFIRAYQKRRKALWLVKQKYTTILVRVARGNEKGPLSAQMMFAALHGVYKNPKERLEDGSFQEHMSFEMVSTDKYIRFYVFVPVHLKDFVQGQIYAQYPNVEISEVEDYTLAKRKEGSHFVGAELSLTRKFFYPIKTPLNFEVDPLSSITGVLSQVEEGEQIWVQVLARPASDSWQRKAMSYVSAVRSGKAKGSSSIIGKIFSTFFKAVFSPEEFSKPAPPPKLSGPVEQAIKAIEEKSTKLGYEAKVRVTFLSNRTPEEMKLKMQSLVGAFKQYNASNLNGFTSGSLYFDDFEFMNAVQTRSFEDEGYILNIEEMASIYHLPTIVVETPTIDWAGSKKGEPPAALPVEGEVDAKDLTVFGQTNFRDKITNFGIKLRDRNQHMYIIGQTGVGKSTVMKMMALDDIREGRGLAIIDPHAEFIDTIMDYIPEHRVKDVVIINPGDRDFCLGFNLLENIDEHKRDLLASSLMSIFMKIWEGVWSARMEWILKNTILALLETPGTTLLSASKMLVNPAYRKMIVDNVKDPVVKAYWVEEFEVQAKTNPKFLVEAITPIQNKIGQFLAVPSIRNMVGQSKSTIDLKDIMDNRKILLVKLSKGDIGEDNMALLGAMIITKIYLTIMERASMEKNDMVDFYLYVDEFQNFANGSFASILSESRKYKLNLIVAHQYIAQLGPDISNAVFGNAGNFISFRVAPQDAGAMKEVFKPVFDETDLVNLDNFHIYVKMMVDGIVYPAFSASTLKHWEYYKEKHNLGSRIVDESRRRYAIPREDVERAILEWSESMASIDTTAGKKEGKREGYGGMGAMGDMSGASREEKKSGEGYREIKDKTGGAWYVRKVKSEKLKVESSVEEGSAAPVAVAEPMTKDHTDSDVAAHAGIKDIEIGDSGLILEDTVTAKKEDSGLILPGSEIDLGDDNTIKPGESIEL